jgi:hypothetical protein
VHYCDSHLHCAGHRVTCRSRVWLGPKLQTQPGSPHTHRTLRADPPSAQQVHSKVSLRRARCHASGGATARPGQSSASVTAVAWALVPERPNDDVPTSAADTCNKMH